MSTPYNRKIQAIVIHHMGDGLPPSVPIQRRWNPAGYTYPEYDFGVEADGTIREGRSLNYIGAHTLSDKPPYSSRGKYWFNQNAIGIGLAGDFTKYAMPKAQFDALVNLVKKLMTQYGLTLDNVYPHGQVTYTSCPGCNYSKVPALKGTWSYDEFEKAVRNAREENTVKNLILCSHGVDERAAGYLADALNAPIAFRDAITQEDLSGVETIYEVGGSQSVSGSVYLSGADRYKTCRRVLDYIEQGS